jgi:SAM-dependent methyltransferase
MKPELVLSLCMKFMESRILLTATELDIFSLLTHPMYAQEIADKTQATLRGVTILLDALVSIGLLEKKQTKYCCSQEVSSLLSKDSPTSIVPMVMHAVGLWKRWSDLTEIVRHGIQKTKPSGPDRSEIEQEAFIGAMHAIASRISPGIVAAINPGAAKNLLDIGGASGSYTQAFLEVSPEMRAAIYDLPSVINIAQKRLAATDFHNRITYIAGDFYLDELPAGYDLVLVSAIIHQNSNEQNIELYRKIYRSLLSGGRLVIRDHVMSPDHTHPTTGAIFAVNMLVGTLGGSTYSFKKIDEGLKTAGFTKIRLIQPDKHMDGLVEAFKI